MIYLQTPLTTSALEKLKVGDKVSISGKIFTARDAAHKRLVELIKKNSPLPFDLAGQIIYYVGPTPARPPHPIGAAGPTTSYRMDPYTPTLLAAGLKGMIGKGPRTKKVIESMIKNKCVYLAAVGGAAVSIAQSIKSCQVIAYEDLGAEAIHQLEVENFICFVANDIYGNDIFQIETEKYKGDFHVN